MRSESSTDKKSRAAKTDSAIKRLKGDFRLIQKAPQGAHPCGAKPFTKLTYDRETINPALCARSLKAVRQALACLTSPDWHRGRPGSHPQGARNHHAELPTPAVTAPTRPAT